MSEERNPQFTPDDIIDMLLDGGMDTGSCHGCNNIGHDVLHYLSKDDDDIREAIERREIEYRDEYYRPIFRPDPDDPWPLRPAPYTTEGIT